MNARVLARRRVREGDRVEPMRITMMTKMMMSHVGGNFISRFKLQPTVVMLAVADVDGILLTIDILMAAVSLFAVVWMEFQVFGI